MAEPTEMSIDMGTRVPQGTVYRVNNFSCIHIFCVIPVIATNRDASIMYANFVGLRGYAKPCKRLLYVCTNAASKNQQMVQYHAIIKGPISNSQQPPTMRARLYSVKFSELIVA